MANAWFEGQQQVGNAWFEGQSFDPLWQEYRAIPGYSIVSHNLHILVFIYTDSHRCSSGLSNTRASDSPHSSVRE